jgi:hypothetical protein
MSHGIKGLSISSPEASPVFPIAWNLGESQTVDEPNLLRDVLLEALESDRSGVGKADCAADGVLDVV